MIESDLILVVFEGEGRSVLFIPGTAYTVIDSGRRCIYLGCYEFKGYKRAKIRYCDNGRHGLREYEFLRK